MRLRCCTLGTRFPLKQLPTLVVVAILLLGLWMPQACCQTELPHKVLQGLPGVPCACVCAACIRGHQASRVLGLQHHLHLWQGPTSDQPSCGCLRYPTGQGGGLTAQGHREPHHQPENPAQPCHDVAAALHRPGRLQIAAARQPRACGGHSPVPAWRRSTRCAGCH